MVSVKNGQVKAASVNGHFDVECHITHDHLDDLLEAMKLHHDMFGVASLLSLSNKSFSHVLWSQAPGLWKSDVDSAFRRIPIVNWCRKFCNVAFVASDRVCHCLLQSIPGHV